MIGLPEIPNTELLSQIGAGGMGQVFLARYRGAYGFEKQVAVKVMDPDKQTMEHVRAMFLDEARLVAQLDHPAITQVYDFGEANETLYLVMEYIAGMPLVDLLRESVRLPPLICASLVANVCRGLHAAHELRDVNGELLNVVHRDVTPQNLVLTFGGRIKILDFGIALMRERTAPVTKVGFIRGKPTYISPEQFEGVALDRRTDIYSISIVLHELLTGEKLFSVDQYLQESATGLSASWADFVEDVSAPSSKVENLPEGLDEVVLKGLALDRADRFSSAKEMALALEEIIQRERCETLEAFVDREFKSAREAHDTRLRSLLGGAPITEVAPPGDVHPGTLVEAVSVELEEPTQVCPAGPEDEGTPVDTALLADAASEAHAENAPLNLPSANPKKARLLMVAILALCLVAGFWGLRAGAPDAAEAPSPSLQAHGETKSTKIPAPIKKAAVEKKIEVRKQPKEPSKPQIEAVLSAPKPVPSTVRSRRKTRRAKARRATDRTKSSKRKAQPKALKKVEDGIITEW